MWVLADIGPPAGANARNVEEGFPLSFDQSASGFGVRGAERDQRQTDAAAVRQGHLPDRTEHPMLVNSLDHLESTLGH